MPGGTLKILFTGDYEPNYNRTRIIRKGLILGGHEVIDFPFKKLNKSEILEKASDCEFIFMPSFTHKQVHAVKKLFPNKKVIFDPLVSRHMTRIFDYKLAPRWGLSALRNYLRDKKSMSVADFVVTDTEAHMNYFNMKFGIPLAKMAPLYIGNDFDVYAPEGQKTKSNIFTVGFYGGFIPLQGVMNILEAAQILKDQNDIQFCLVGSGFEFEKAKSFVSESGLNNVELPGWIQNENELAAKICEFDICLGIFGDTIKSDLVIPNKVYHYAACAKPIITKKSPAIQELFSHEKDIYLCGTRGQDIAELVLKVKSEPQRAEQIGQLAYHNLLANFSSEMVGAKLVSYYEQL